jgi:hypothetical protein
VVESRPLLRLATVCALCIGVITAGSVPVGAQEPEPEPTQEGPSAADKETARTLFRDGDEKFRAKDYEGALKVFLAADEIMGVPTTGLEHARTLMMMGRLLEARDGFIKVANREKRDEELAAQQAARDEANELASDLAKRIPSVRVVISNKPDGVEVRLRIDDVDIPAPAVEFARKVDPGEHTVKVFVAGYKPEIREIEIPEKREEVVEITLEASDGDVNLVDPWGGADDGGVDDGRGVLPVLSWIGFSVGLAGLIVGVPTGIVAIKAKDTLEVECKPTSPICPPGKQGDLDSAKTIAHVSTVGFVFAGVGIAVGVIGILIRASLPDALAAVDTPVTVRPYVGAGALGVTGTF